MSQQRRYIAFSVAGVVFLIAVTTMALILKTQNWGILIMLIAPFVVFGLIRMARALERWARSDEEDWVDWTRKDEDPD